MQYWSRCRLSTVPLAHGRLTSLTTRLQLRCLSDFANSTQQVPQNTTTAFDNRLPQNAHFISTIDPDRLTEQDFVQFTGSDITTVKGRDVTLPNGKPATWMFRYGRHTSTPWPENSSGFLYLHKPPSGGPISASSIRMRITNNPDPKSFATGEDLDCNGLPWEAPLLLVPLVVFEPLIERDELLPSKHRSRVRTLATFMKNYAEKNGLWWKKIHTPVLYRKNQPFYIEFGSPRQQLWIVKEVEGIDRVMPMELPLPGLKSRERDQSDGSLREPAKYRPLYDGAALVRMEAQTSEASTALSLRIVKVVRPIVVRRDAGMKLPELKEGSIVPRIHPESKMITDAFVFRDLLHPVRHYATLPDLPEEGTSND